jgi:hypothetical protein
MKCCHHDVANYFHICVLLNRCCVASDLDDDCCVANLVAK